MIKKHKNFLMGWILLGHFMNYGMEDRYDKNFSNINLLTPQSQGYLIQLQEFNDSANDISMNSNGEQITSSFLDNENKELKDKKHTDHINKQEKSRNTLKTVVLRFKKDSLMESGLGQKNYTNMAIKLPKNQLLLQNDQNKFNVSVSETKTKATKSTKASSNHQLDLEADSDESFSHKTSSDESKTSSDESMKDEDSSYENSSDNIFYTKTKKQPKVINAKTKTRQGSLIAKSIKKPINSSDYDSDEGNGSEDYRMNSNIQKPQLRPKENVEMIDTSSKYQPILQHQIDEIENEDLINVKSYIEERIEYVRISIENSKKTRKEKEMHIAAAKEALRYMIPAIWAIKNLKFGKKDLVDELINIVIESSEDRDRFIWNCLGSDQQKEMEEIVKTLMGLFPEGKFPKVFSALRYLHTLLKKDIPQNELLENIKLFLTKKKLEKELKKFYEDYTQNIEIHGLIGIDNEKLRSFIDESLTKTREAIEKNIKKEDQERYIKATKKVLIPIIIKMFQMEMDIKDYTGEHYQKSLIDPLINIVTESENKVTESENRVKESENRVTDSNKRDICNCLGNDQRKIMNLIVRILIRVFPPTKFKKINNDFHNLLKDYSQKDIPDEEVRANKILFLMKKESEKYYKSIITETRITETRITGNIPDGIQLTKKKEEVMAIIKEKLKLITQIDENKKEAFKKAIICIIIEMFRIPIEIFRIQNLNREKLIDFFINIICTSSYYEKHTILTNISDDQQKPMNPIVTTVMGFFPAKKFKEFKDVYHKLYHLLNKYLKGYLKNAEAQNAGFKVPDQKLMGNSNKRNLKQQSKRDFRSSIMSSSSKAKSGMNHILPNQELMENAGNASKRKTKMADKQKQKVNKNVTKNLISSSKKKKFEFEKSKIQDSRIKKSKIQDSEFEKSKIQDSEFEDSRIKVSSEKSDYSKLDQDGNKQSVQSGMNTFANIPNNERQTLTLGESYFQLQQRKNKK
jgi:hypothetical protein